MNELDVLSDCEKNHHKIAYNAAVESIVLLKNDGVLPLANIKNIALYGSGAEITLNGGTGSGEVHARYDVSIKEGLENKGFSVTTAKWIDDYKNEYNKALKKGNRVIAKRILNLTVSNMINIIADSIKYPHGRKITIEDVQESKTDTCVYVISRQSGEASDRLLKDNTLSEVEKYNIEFIQKHYKKIIVVINSGSTLEMSWLNDYKGINALIYYGQPGMEGGNALADILTGEINPSGKLVDTWYNSYNDVAFSDEYGYLNKDSKTANYKESIYVGYRYIDSFNKPYAFPFGYGMSYTKFAYDFYQIKNDGSKIEIEIKVKNIGDKYFGKEVIQVYLGFPNKKINREYQSLVSFGKSKLLAPSEEEILTLKFDLKDFAYYDVENAKFALEDGEYIVRVGTSSKFIKEVAIINLKEEVVTEECINAFSLNVHFDLLKSPLNENKKLKDKYPTIYLNKEDFSSLKHNYNCNVSYNEEERKLLDTLTTDQKLELVVGTGFMGTNEVPGAYSTTTKLKEKNINNIIMSDGPSGLRIHRRVGFSKRGKIVRLEENYPFLQGLPKILKKIVFSSCKKVDFKYQNITAFCSPSTLSHSWNVNLAKEVGVALAEEMKEYGITHLLGPAINIHRNPLCGRNFEYFSEDPILTAKMASSVCEGVQSIKGCFVTLKHFVANNQETQRTFMSSNVDERTLREIYLKAFKMVIRESNIKSIMSSYNKLNGIYTCNSKALCTDILRSEFGFKGLVMTDWLSTGKGLASNGLAIASGNDLIMPGGKYYIKTLKKELKKGLFTIEDLDKAVINIIKCINESK